MVIVLGSDYDNWIVRSLDSLLYGLLYSLLYWSSVSLACDLPIGLNMFGNVRGTWTVLNMGSIELPRRWVGHQVQLQKKRNWRRLEAVRKQVSNLNQTPVIPLSIHPISGLRLSSLVGDTIEEVESPIKRQIVFFFLSKTSVVCPFLWRSYFPI